MPQTKGKKRFSNKEQMKAVKQVVTCLLQLIFLRLLQVTADDIQKCKEIKGNKRYHESWGCLLFQFDICYILSQPERLVVKQCVLKFSTSLEL